MSGLSNLNLGSAFSSTQLPEILAYIRPPTHNTDVPSVVRCSGSTRLSQQGSTSNSIWLQPLTHHPSLSLSKHHQRTPSPSNRICQLQDLQMHNMIFLWWESLMESNMSSWSKIDTQSSVDTRSTLRLPSFFVSSLHSDVLWISPLVDPNTLEQNGSC